MASASMQSEIASEWKYDVFLSFSGEDTRKNFTSHLYSALDRQGIFTFKDNHRLERGKVISLELFKAIEESRFGLVVLSENYASSTWCLDELAKILECKKDMGQIVLPVFYKVTPSEVRHQTGSFEKAFAEHEHNFREDMGKVQRWRNAMRQISHLSGWHLQTREESEFIQVIVDEILSKLGSTLLNTSDNLVGMDSRMKQIDPLLGIGLNDVRMLGICGMGGIGKTTLARFVFNKISYQFDGSCFLSNVREVSMTRGLNGLQQQLIYDILMERNVIIWDVHRGCNEIRRRLRHKRVLVVLDDVDQLEQLQALAGMHDWFGQGSRIIITTRDRHTLVRHCVDNVHMVHGLNHEEALQLFCRKAFRKDHPTDHYLELSFQMVHYANGLPLALEVLGSFLFGRSKAEWKDALDRLKEVPDKRIFEILKISYDGLQELEKKIFLDVACFFKGKDKDETRELLDSCNFHPDIGISVLIDKCIITLSDNTLCMHDLIQSMGWEIVRQESREKPGQRSRLWLSNDIHRVLTKNEGTEAVEGIILDICSYKELKLNAKSFSRMSNLRLLKIKDVSLCRCPEYLSDELRLLNWHGYPLRSLPSNFQHNKLLELNMCYSHIKQLWKGVKHLNHLKKIILSHSTYLTKTPDFTGTPNLERLILDGCTSLSFVHPTIGLLRKLILLNLKDCKRLRSLRTKIEWESLQVLILSGCSNLSDVGEIVSNVKHLMRLKVLDLSGCSKLDKLPENLGHLASLKNLDLSETAITQAPSSIVLLKNLEQLSFHGCKGEPQKSWSLFPVFSRANPEPIGLRLPFSLSGLCSLRHLDLGDCNLQEGAIPSDIGFLPSLVRLNLSRNNFVSLPPSISQLPKLETLFVEYCYRLQALPELPASVDGLYAQNCTSSEKISSSSSHLFKSTSRMYYLNNCFKLAGSRTNGVTVTFFKNVLNSLLKSQLLGLKCGVTHSEFEIVVPGSQVPDWFIYRSKGSSIGICQQLTGRGLALCAAFSVDHRSISDRWMKLNCKLGTPIVSMSVPLKSLAGTDHLWLFYISRSYLTNEDFFYLKEVSFQAENVGSITFKECGLRLIDDSDIEEFIRASYNLSTSTNSEVLDPDRLAVTSTIIKRSRDYYYPDQQLYPKRLR